MSNNIVAICWTAPNILMVMRTSGWAVAAFFFTTVLGGCAGPSEDSFRARIPAACTTEDSCAALEQEARQRFAACEAAGGGRGCDDPQADMIEVGRRHQEVRKTIATASPDQRARDESATSMAEAVRLRDVRQTLDGSCDDQKKIDAAVAATPSNVPASSHPSYEQGLREDAARKRAVRIADAARTVEYDARRPVRAAEAANPDDAMHLVENARGPLIALRCEGQPSDDLASAQSKFDEWSAAVAKQVSEEKACRASTECMANRLAAPICETIERRKGLAQAIAQENANPSGYVNKTLLHDLGTGIQNADAELADLKKDFRATTKKDFTEARCSKRAGS